ncbi:MAG: aspartyl/glutamyl-tRNA amidotransferase subunit C [Chloroflexi bacterium]|nr:aspartyl/glutamyl-tRNA amidotransferase subunit C [Chloroflexota bacterium]
MRLTREQVQHIATLCRVGMSEDDLARLQDQLSNILEQFEKLKELDTANVPPTAQPAPQRDGDLLRIKAVLEE